MPNPSDGNKPRPIRLLAAAFAPAVIVLFFIATGVATPSARDRDHDGLSDRFERRTSHTLVRKADTDRDGLKDGAEVRRFKTKPRRKDTDRDGLKDGPEVHRFKTRPRRKDTDLDGLKDGAEVHRFKTNPRRKDTDGDGLTDGEEVRRYKTNPRERDTDGDGVSDGDEVAVGTDPTSPPGGSGPPGEQSRPARACSQSVSSLDAVRSAVGAAAPGSVICLANGSYGKLDLSSEKSAEVVIQPASRAGATISGAGLGGTYLTLFGFNVTGGGVSVEPGSNHITVEFNRIAGGYLGVDAGPTTTTTVNDVTIRGNKFVGNFGEDAIRLNRYHDGPDPDPYGALVEGNEISGVVEDGNHNDCLQTVWAGDHLYLRRNYLHANNCQGFFVKDQATSIDTVVVEDNLIIDHTLPCQPASLCPTWVLAPFQVFGPIHNHVVRRNTFWTPYRSGVTIWRGAGLQGVEIDHNVIYRAESDTTIGGYAEHDNTVCRWSGLPALSSTSSRNCSPAFANPGAHDYRLASGHGVSWAPAEQDYGP